MIGFVLDRTTTPVRLRMDGSAKVLDLEIRNQSQDGTDLVHRSPNLLVRIEANGRVTYIDDLNRAMPMKRDADAASLSSTDTPTPPPTNDIPRGRLGHYSSGDGLVGFVLDRTGKKPKLKMDDDAHALELDVMPGSHGDVALTYPVRGTVVLLGDHGEVTFFMNGKAFHMRRDADAAPIP